MSKEKVLQSNAHRFFWVYAVIFSILFIVMILFSSFSQEKLKNEKQEIRDQLTQEKNYSKGIQESAQDVSQENDALKTENQNLKDEIDTLKEEKERLKEENHNYQKNLELLQNLKDAYVMKNEEECLKLLEQIDETLIPEDELEQFCLIKNDLI